MQSSGRDNRIDVQLLMQEETDPIDDLSEVENEADESGQDQLAELTAKHENLRRQVASTTRACRTGVPSRNKRNFETPPVTPPLA